MKALKIVFLKDWKNKVMALIIAVTLWTVVNFGNRTTLTVTRSVDIRNGNAGFTYRIKPQQVEITVYVVERLIASGYKEKVNAYVDLSGISRSGVYKLKVQVDSDLPLLVQPAGVEPSEVKVFAERKSLK